MSKQKLRVLFGMVERDADEIFNLRRALTTDPEERLALVWEDLENIYGHRDREPGMELDKLHRKPAVECTEKGVQTLLKESGTR